MNFANSWNVFWGVLKNEYWQQLLLKGIKNTIEIAVFGLIIGIVLGTIIALVKVAPKYKLIMRILDKICSIYSSAEHLWWFSFLSRITYFSSCSA